MADVYLDATNLSVAYGSRMVLENVGLQLHSGEIVGLVGRNGAGKSSLMRSLAGLQPVVSGSVWARGVSVTERPEAARGVIGMVPQDVALFDELSAEETLLLAGRLRGLSGDPLRDEVNRWLTLTDLLRVGKSMAREYSGGMRRKLALGATMIGAPPVLLLDESFAGLDAEATEAIEDELRRHRDAGAAILLCSHRMELLERIADRVVLLERGSIRDELSRTAIDALAKSADASLLQWYLDRVRRGVPA